MQGLVIGIRYLTGYAASTDLRSRAHVEWPPHPGRVFMALAAAHFETGAGPGERQELLWLEKQPPPVIRAGDRYALRVVTAFVPVNAASTRRTRRVDESVHKTSTTLQSAPAIPRTKQARTFLRAWLEDDRVFLVWPECPDPQIRKALEGLCAKVTRIGHSSSLVQVWLADQLPPDAPAQTWEPDEIEADVKFRVPTEGLLQRLQDDFDRGDRPKLSLWAGYRTTRPEGAEPVASTVWSASLIVRRLAPLDAPQRHLGSLCTLQVTQRLHEAVLSQAPEPVPEFISGHQPNGAPSERPHLAYLPLSFVGSEHATGQLMGIGVALPSGLTRTERLAALAAVGKVRTLKLGPLGEWALEADDLGKVNLQAAVWTASPHGARRWATVTPIAFDRHPKAKSRLARERQEADMIRCACARVGLPEPARVRVSPVSAHPGVPAAHEFPRMRRKDGSERRHTHAILLFAQPVQGPIALGAGRYRGYGFCRPLPRTEGAA